MHLYLHVPFCKQACHYCDFHFSTNLALKTEMVAAMAQEIAQQKSYLQNKNLTTIYFGGGTPSLLSLKDLQLLFETISQHFSLEHLKEVTLEANPDDITKDTVEVWQKAGINRLSLGVQSFDDATLRLMNRPHSGSEAKKAIDLLQKQSNMQISVDLIYARLPQNKNDFTIFKNDLHTLIDFDLPHISAYSLTIEEKTVFGHWLKKEIIKPIADETAAEEYNYLISQLLEAKYEQYEVSNFAKNGHYAVHNSSYWLDEEYLGIGPSAHSYNGWSRHANVSQNAGYIKGVAEGNLNRTTELLTPKEQANDLLLCGLRTQWGVDIKKISQKLGHIEARFWEKISELEKKNWVTLSNDCLKITPDGRLFSDRIAEDLFFE
jgi:oxygen-independent coproporphyrinogen III oxidase